MKKKTNHPPKHLSAGAKRWWRLIREEFDITDDAGKLLLQTAMEAFDRAVNCRTRIDEDGELVKDRFDQMKPHPLLAAERDARTQMLAAMKQMNLDLEPLRDRPGRPGGR